MAYKISQSKKRRVALNRRANGTFGPWKGGKTKAQLKKKKNPFKGIAIHIGKEFVKQHGHKARVGSICRFKKLDGSFHRQAEWYVKTKHGWRKTRTRQRKPTRSQIINILKISRKGQ